MTIGKVSHGKSIRVKAGQGRAGIAAVIQARLTSSRLPCKVLLPLGGKTVLERVVATCQAINGIGHVVVAIPDNENNDPLVPFVRRSGAILIRGSEHDVLSRYVDAATAVGAAKVLRITADCPLHDHKVCEQVIEKLIVTGADYCSNVMPRSFPAGLDAEAFTVELLMKAHKQASDPYDREHVTPLMQRMEGIKRVNVTAPEDRSHLNWCLDTAEDFVRLSRMVQ